MYNIIHSLSEWNTKTRRKTETDRNKRSLFGIEFGRVKMIRHVVIWNYADGFSEQQNIENAKKMKDQIEDLAHCISGITDLKVIINPLSSSNADVLLDSMFESEEALAAYQIHPAHQQVSQFVGTVMKNRKCIDYHDNE